MKRLIVCVVLTLSVLLLFACAAPQTDNGEPAGAETSATSVPEDADGGIAFSLTDLNGNAIDDAYFGEHKLTMMNFWASWCGPCVREIPELQRLSAEYADKGFAILGVLLWDEDTEGARRFLEKQGVTYPVVVSEGALAELGKAYDAIPTTLFVGADGKPIGKPIIGADDYDGWKKRIDALLETLG